MKLENDDICLHISSPFINWPHTASTLFAIKFAGVCGIFFQESETEKKIASGAISEAQIIFKEAWQPLGPLLKVKLLVGYM